MVAPNGRASALALVAMLVASSIVIALPAALAQPTFTVALSVPTGTATPLPVGTVVTWSVTGVTAPSCTPTGTPTAQLTITIAGILAATNAGGALTVTGTTAAGSGTFTIAANQPNGVEDAAKTFAASIAWDCAVADPDPTAGETTPIAVDTKVPVVTPTAISLSHFQYAPSDSRHVPAGEAKSTTAGIGAYINFTATAVESAAGSGVATFTVNSAAVPGGASENVPIGANPRSVSKAHAIHIATAGTTNGVSRNVVLTAVDVAGNTATRTLPLVVDDQPPTDPITLDAATLTRSPDGVVVKLSFPPPASAAAVFVTSNGVTRSAVVADDVQTPLFTFGSSWEPITDEIDVRVYPADAGGNVDLSPTSVLEPQFPDDITLELGGTPVAPAALRGNEFRNIYVNVSEAHAGTAPLYPTRATGSAGASDLEGLKVYAELVRLRTREGLAPLFWRNATTGNDLSVGQNGDFRETESGQTGDTNPAEPFSGTGADADGDPSAFLPGANAPGCDTGVACYLFTNLSTSRAVSDGIYELWVNVRGPDGSRTLLKHPLIVDGNDTKISPARNFSAKGVQAATATAIHGADGNPIRVTFNTTDWTLTANGNGVNFHDSGLRNVTVELVKSDQSALVLNSSRSQSLPLIERAARLNITRDSCTPNWSSASDRASRVLPYCHDITDWTPTLASGWCPGILGVTGGANLGSWNQTCFVYDDVVVSDTHRGFAQTSQRWVNQTWTFINATQFSGWVNVSMDDLPAGKYKVRVLSYDHAGRSKAEVYGASDSDLYKVAPAVRLQTSTTSPSITDDGRIIAEVYGMQHYAAPIPSEVAPSCVAGRTSVKDVCPPERIRIYVSNSDSSAASNVGVEYVAINSFATSPDTLPDFRSVAAMNDDGSFTLLSRSLKMFKNASFLGPTLASVPDGDDINVNAPVYVRAVAETADGAVSNSTGWVRAASANAPSLQITRPAVPWSLYPTGSLPELTVTFDRKADLPAPKLSWWVFEADAPFDLDPTTAATFVAKGENLTPLNSGLTAPKVKFNWSDTIDDAGAALAPGEYRVVVVAYDSTSTAGSPQPLGAPTSQTFAILEAQSIVVGNLAGSEGVYKPTTGTTYYTAKEFEVPFEVTHSFANLTDVDDLKFKLVRSVARPGQPNTVTPGQDGFTVEVRAETPLDSEEKKTSFVARITLPNGAVDGDSFRLNITAEVDEQPHLAGNITRLVDFTHDKIPAAGGLLVRESEATVFDFDTEKNKATYAPAFIGFGEDLGSGVKSVEVRIYDITANETLHFTTAAPKRKDGLTNDWTSTTGTTGPLTLAAAANGRRVWTLTPTASSIDASHSFRVDARVVDNLGQRSEINTTIFDFDAAPPLLGYGGRLDTTTSMRSGIILGAGTTTTVDWHGEADLMVRVSDNDCIAEVRLKGFHESNPSEIVSAVMEPDRERCYAAYGSQTTDASRRYQIYELDLADATQLTDKIGNYTYWFEAYDALGQHAEVPPAFRLFEMLVVDTAPPTVTNITLDPPVGQAGSRALVRAEIFDNYKVDRVEITARQGSTVLGTAQMRPSENVDENGTGVWIADTTDDLQLDLETGNYTFAITAYDVFWNRTEGGEPTCEDAICTASNKLYAVRDDGPPATVLESPSAGAVVNATPVLKLRALHKLLDTSGITLTLGVEGEETTVPASDIAFTELTSTNGTRQGWSLVYEPADLTDGANITLGVRLNVGGLVNETSYAFRVDALPPLVTANVTGTVDRANKTWAVSATQVTLTAEDNVSATTRLYTVNGGPQQTYTGPITPAGDDGVWTLQYWATDGAGNAAQKQTLTLNLDRSGPRIVVSTHGDQLLLIVTDTGVGLNESSVTVHYRYGEAISFATKVAERTTTNSFSAILPGNATATGLAYYFTAQDTLGNVGTNFSAAAPYAIPKAGSGGGGNTTNLEPTISITAPAPGASAARVFDLKWLAEDPEGATVTITIALSDPAPGKLISAAGDNSGTYRLNLSGPDYPAGAYTLVVTASDGEKTASDRVTFNLEAGETIKPITVPPPTVQANQQVNIGVSITPAGKTVLQASYRVIKDGQLYTSGKLTSASGAYGAAFTPTESGSYRVLVDVAYSDGTTDASKQVAAFSVAGDGTGAMAKVFPGSLMALVAIAVLTVALAAYGAFGRWKK